ncbi:hypothetical protein A7C82_17290 [Salmonella enterica subsp. enterica serovar Panama]|nr:hypothetical protein [Salmonella enterica subsp. enterica serovar Panama]
MLRTGPAALSRPGPCGAAGFHPTVATSTAGLLRPFRSRRFHHAGDKPAGILRAPRRSAVSGVFILSAAGMSLSQ